MGKWIRYYENREFQVYDIVKIVPNEHTNKYKREFVGKIAMVVDADWYNRPVGFDEPSYLLDFNSQWTWRESELILIKADPYCRTPRMILDKCGSCSKERKAECKEDRKSMAILMSIFLCGIGWLCTKINLLTWFMMITGINNYYLGVLGYYVAWIIIAFIVTANDECYDDFDY